MLGIEVLLEVLSAAAELHVPHEPRLRLFGIAEALRIPDERAALAHLLVRLGVVLDVKRVRADYLDVLRDPDEGFLEPARAAGLRDAALGLGGQGCASSDANRLDGDAWSGLFLVAEVVGQTHD